MGAGLSPERDLRRTAAFYHDERMSVNGFEGCEPLFGDLVGPCYNRRTTVTVWKSRGYADP
jgi:hypothetical protein